MDTIDQVSELREPLPPTPVVETAPSEAEVRPRARAQVALARLGTALAAVSTGALAIGAFAVGALAIRSLAVRALRVKRGTFGRIVVDELEIGRLTLREAPTVPLRVRARAS